MTNYFPKMIVLLSGLLFVNLAVKAASDFPAAVLTSDHSSRVVFALVHLFNVGIFPCLRWNEGKMQRVARLRQKSCLRIAPWCKAAFANAALQHLLSLYQCCKLSFLHGSHNTLVLKMTRRIGIRHKAECHLIFLKQCGWCQSVQAWPNKRDTGSIHWVQRDRYVVLLERCKKQIAPLLGFQAHTVIVYIQGAHEARQCLYMEKTLGLS